MTQVDSSSMGPIISLQVDKQVDIQRHYSSDSVAPSRSSTNFFIRIISSVDIS